MKGAPNLHFVRPCFRSVSKVSKDSTICKVRGMSEEHNSSSGALSSQRMVWMDRILVPPLPRNMHPDYNQGRRKARAAALLKTAAAMPDSVAFVDAAKYPN
ncbi:hypothetical protein HPB52_014327 [Rhipicephalus sanguineus]|uniref:Uncharacterized protein n=1 Tax=Rhipicephalus sanguineus TaxID=34632 RepID=A0A9D4PWI1_RHISA|nr:hypothetical protein HPB52_014327 [Rhipicephalus sanguineus]